MFLCKEVVAVIRVLVFNTESEINARKMIVWLTVKHWNIMKMYSTIQSFVVKHRCEPNYHNYALSINRALMKWLIGKIEFTSKWIKD